MKRLFWLISLLVIALSPRLFLIQAAAGPVEFSAIFLYASDIAILLYIVCSTLSAKESVRVGIYNRLFLGLCVISLIGSVMAAQTTTLAMVSFIRLLLIIGFVIFGSEYLKVRYNYLQALGVVVFLGVVEAVIGIAQYAYQHDLGLYSLGEPHLSAQLLGVAKLDLYGTKIMRAYGTFLHPNVLAAFLGLSLIIASYLYLYADKRLYRFDIKKSLAKNFNIFITSPYLYLRIGLVLVVATISFALALTFSRAGWLGAIVGLVVLVLFSLKKAPRAALRLCALLLCVGLAIYLTLQPLIVSRISPRAYPESISERVLYDSIGLAVVATNPAFGVGLGNYIVSQSSGVFMALGLTESWQQQPPHNFFIILVAEIGIFGLLSFISLLAMVVIRLGRVKTSQSALGLSLLALVITSSMFDHFFWTLQQGRLIYGLVLALCLSQIVGRDK